VPDTRAPSAAQSPLKTRILEDVKGAMRARDAARLGLLRMVTAAIKQVEIDERCALDDSDVIGILEKLIKQRREAAEQYRRAGREDRAEAEEREIGLIEDYLPAALGEDELATLIERAVAETGAGTVKDMGRVMAGLRPQVKGRADMRVVSEKVKARLG